jgi:hypothetical protein
MKFYAAGIKGNSVSYPVLAVALCCCFPCQGRTVYTCLNSTRSVQLVLISPLNKHISSKTMEENEFMFEVVLDYEDGSERGSVGEGSGFFVLKNEKILHLSRNDSYNDDYFDMTLGDMEFVKRSFTRLGDDKVFMSYQAGVCGLQKR